MLRETGLNYTDEDIHDMTQRDIDIILDECNKIYEDRKKQETKAMNEASQIPKK